MAYDNVNLLSYGSGRQKSEMGLIGLKSTCQQGYIHCGASREESSSLPFPPLIDSLKSLASGPFLHLQNQQWLVKSFSHGIPVLLKSLPSSPFKDLCDHIGPTQIIEGNLLILRSAD